MNVTVQHALSGSLYFHMTCDQGVTGSGYVYLDVRDRSPRFSITPQYLDVIIARGGATVFQDVVVENIGSQASGGIQLFLPDQRIVRTVSNDILPGLAVDEKRTVSFAFQATADMEVGTTYSGSIGIQSARTVVVLHFRTTVVSEAHATLTVITQDEATFFADDHPNLDDVWISIRSLTLGTTVSNTSGPNGTAIFDGLLEDYYEVYAQKLGHQPFRKEIYLQPPGLVVEAFLMTESVSYTFTVVPVEVLDKYIIEVQATFETFVPRPVVVWEPVVLDWEGIRAGRVRELRLTATNYGLIAAKDVTVEWGNFFENARFILPNEDEDPSRIRNLGTLPANSSIDFTVEIVPIRRFNVPDGWIEARDWNNILYLPLVNDSSWTTGPSMIVIPDSDPVNGQAMLTFREDGLLDSVYWFASGTFLTCSTTLMFSITRLLRHLTQQFPEIKP